MSTCGICTFVQSISGDKTRAEINNALRDKKNTEEKVVEILGAAGFRVSTSLVGKHRRQHMTDLLEPSTAKDKTPAGWEPFSEYTDSIGSAIVRLPTPKATARDLLIQAGFDPGSWQISGPINTRRWMRYDQEWLYYYKFDVIAGESPEVVQEHVDELVGVIRKRRSSKSPVKGSSANAFVFAASDWQIGKAEGLDGTPQTVDRVLKSIEMAVQRIGNLRRQGHSMPTLLFTGLGDLGEGTCGFYPGQSFLIDRNRREQGRINRELITAALDTLYPIFDETLVAVVGGNHGENRSPKGERMTNDADNDDCAYFDAVREAFDRSGGHNITWQIMQDELSMAVTAGGVPIGLTHGHLFERSAGGTPQAKAKTWWTGQDFGFQNIRGTRILLSAHFHHFSATTFGPRTHLQTPAMDPGSKWFRQARGEDSPPGTLTFRLDHTHPLGWDDLSVLHPGHNT